MKILKQFTAAVLAVSVLSGPFVALAADQGAAKPKPYTLKTCVVSGEKLGEMGDPYTFVYQGQELKLCCKSCLKDFNKNPAKYLKKMKEEEAKSKEKAKK